MRDQLSGLQIQVNVRIALLLALISLLDHQPADPKEDRLQKLYLLEVLSSGMPRLDKCHESDARPCCIQNLIFVPSSRP